MLIIDLQNAFGGDSKADNFTVQLLRLIAKADNDNWKKLSKVYPKESYAVAIYRESCPYMDKGEVDWNRIVYLAELFYETTRGDSDVSKNL